MGHIFKSDLQLCCKMIFRWSFKFPATSVTQIRYFSTRVLTSAGLCKHCRQCSLRMQVFPRPFGRHKIAVTAKNNSVACLSTTHTTELEESTSEKDRVSETVYTEINSESEIFLDKLQSCRMPQDVLTVANESVEDTSLPTALIPAVFTRYNQLVYASFSFPWLLPQVNLKKKQLKFNFLQETLIQPFTTDSKFMDFVAFTEEHVIDLPVDACVEVLQSLDYLFLTKGNPLLEMLLERCLQSIECLNIRQLAIISSCFSSEPKDYIALGKIGQATKNWLSTHATQDTDLDDMIEVFTHIEPVVSAEMVDLGVQVIIDNLALNPANITLHKLSKISLFSRVLRQESRETLVNKILGFPPLSFQNVEITSEDLTFDVCSVINKDKWLSPLLNRVQFQCITELSQANTVPDLAKLLLPLNRIPHKVSDNVKGIVTKCVMHSDNFLLSHLMKCHAQTDLLRLSRDKELLYAYHLRLVRLVSGLSQEQLDQLLWDEDEGVGLLVFKFLMQLSAHGIYLNKNLVQTIEAQTRLSETDWDVPKQKVFVATLKACVKLKEDIQLSSRELQDILKFLNCLEIGDVMKLMKAVEQVLLQRSLSSKTRDEALQMRKKLSQIFEDKLAMSKFLSPSLTSSDLLPAMVPDGRSQHLRRKGLYSHLLNSLPRFVRDGEEKNCLRVLSILAVASRIFPLYQEETYEQLISFVTGSPQLLVYSGVELIKVLAHSGYQPQDTEHFMDWSLQLVRDVINRDAMCKSNQVKLAYHLSLLGIFHDELVCHIFNLDFMLALDKELELSQQRSAQVKKYVGFLNRAVALECPHLSVVWFSDMLPQRGDRVLTSLTEKVLDSIARSCGDPQLIDRCAQSPYGHHIDALLHFDSKKRLVRHEGSHPRHEDEDYEKVAVLVLGPSKLCVDSDKLTGWTQANVRQLQILGYTVIQIVHTELSSMEIYNEESLDRYVRDKINDSVGFPLLPDRQTL